MRLPIFQIDAFASTVFRGNPAAVCPLERWLDEPVLQAIAQENNLSETAFFVSRGTHYELRWFTPQAEVDLCGHATMASAFVLFHEMKVKAEVLEFGTRSGRLRVFQRGDELVLDLPRA